MEKKTNKQQNKTKKNKLKNNRLRTNTEAVINEKEDFF